MSCRSLVFAFGVISCGFILAAMAEQPDELVIESLRFDSLAPYTGPLTTASAAREMDDAFGRAIRTDNSADRIEAIEAYRGHRRALLERFGTLDANHPNTTLAADDILKLAWRLSSKERVTLLRHAMQANAAMEATVVSALYLCVVDEIVIAASATSDPVIIELLDAHAILEIDAVARQRERASEIVWLPDPTFRAYDAAELAEAWISAVNPEEARGRVEHLLALATACPSPRMVPMSAGVYWQSDIPTLIATHALFPLVEEYNKKIGGKLDLEIAQSRQIYRLTDALVDLVDRIESLRTVVRRQGEEIVELRSSIAKLSDRVEDIDQRLTQTEEKVRNIDTRLKVVEGYMSHKMSLEKVNALLDRLAPVLVHNDWDSGPLMSPRDFMADATFLVLDETDPRVIKSLDDRGRPFKSSTELTEWLLSDAGGTPMWKLTYDLELIPNHLRKSGLLGRSRAAAVVREMNQETTDEEFHNRAQIFGAVLPLKDEGAEFWSVKYFWFHALSDAAFPDGEGDHEGDWGCLDLTVNIPFDAQEGGHDISAATVVDAIFHEHGNPNRFPQATLMHHPEKGRVMVYLENGTNEAHPKSGDKGRFKGVWPYEWPVILAHNGNGYEYDTRGAIHNIFDPEQIKNPDVAIVRYYRGQWGEWDGDHFKGVPFIGHDTTNPHGPLDNAKFRSRVGVIDQRHSH